MESNNEWGATQNAQLTQLREEGKKPKEIAEIMDRSVRTIYYKEALLGNRKKKTTQHKHRLCLGGCNKYFMSSGPGNRICPTCSKRDRTGVITPASLHV